jgi:hypothetical protein
MSPTSERRLPRPSVEARVQLDRVELLCVPGEPIPGCQRGLVQHGVPVVVAPSRRPDPDVTHSSPIAAVYPPSLAGGGLLKSTSSSLPIDRPPVAASRPPDNKALTARAHSTNRPSRVRTTQLRELSCRHGQAERARRGPEPGPTDPGVAARDGGVHLGVTAQRTPPQIPMAPLRSGLIDERRLGH